MKVYKEYLRFIPNTPIYTDVQGELLTIEKQKDRIVAYFDADAPYYHKYLIYFVQTGQQVDVQDTKYLKTLMFKDGDYVIHIFIKEIFE